MRFKILKNPLRLRNIAVSYVQTKENLHIQISYRGNSDYGMTLIVLGHANPIICIDRANTDGFTQIRLFGESPKEIKALTGPYLNRGCDYCDTNLVFVPSLTNRQCGFRKDAILNTK